MKPAYVAGPEVLLVDDAPVARVTVARTHQEKGRGLLGTSSVEGALWLDGASSVHMMGMAYPIDVAVLDRDGVVLKVATLPPWTGLTRPRLKGRAVVEAAAGSMTTWGVRKGARLSVGRPDAIRDRASGGPGTG
ncbi:DUF192 domain-containing protein [Ornithinimicrobium sp. Y1694]|uniref:DUF192 domain-containing protein n=1 Tax=Ornithinimicrobium sp. Y1694 TaxID=3418590 RepID=UPI003CF426A8